MGYVALVSFLGLDPITFVCQEANAIVCQSTSLQLFCIDFSTIEDGVLEVDLKVVALKVDQKTILRVVDFKLI